MASVTEDDLVRAAAALGLPLERNRIRAILPEVQRILEAAQRLRDLPIDAAEGPLFPTRP